jgi:hypothetical protein
MAPTANTTTLVAKPPPTICPSLRYVRWEATRCGVFQTENCWSTDLIKIDSPDLYRPRRVDTGFGIHCRARFLPTRSGHALLRAQNRVIRSAANGLSQCSARYSSSKQTFYGAMRTGPRRVNPRPNLARVWIHVHTRVLLPVTLGEGRQNHRPRVRLDPVRLGRYLK